MRAAQSEYMHWAKFQKPVRFSLSGSEVPHFRLDSLPLTIADLDLDGASHPRYLPLRDRIGARYGVSVESVVVADGASMANFLAIAALIEPGDEVLIERPSYEPLLAAASFLGADIQRFERKAEEGFRLDSKEIESALTANTRLIVVTNVHNPSGALTQEDDLRALGRLASQSGARVLVDEVYLDSALPPGPTSAHLGPEFVITNSLTKCYGLSGLRSGWILAEPELTERMWRLNDLFGVNQAHPAERLACFAFDHIDEITRDNPAMLARNRVLFNDFVASRDDLDCMAAEHGMTAFPRWSGGDTQWLDDLLRERFDTSVVPGRWFDMPDHFRVGLAYPTAHLQAGLQRLCAALDQLR